MKILHAWNCVRFCSYLHQWFSKWNSLLTFAPPPPHTHTLYHTILTASGISLLPSLCKLLYQLCEASSKSELDGIHAGVGSLQPTALLLTKILEITRAMNETNPDRFTKVRILPRFSSGKINNSGWVWFGRSLWQFGYHIKEISSGYGRVIFYFLSMVFWNDYNLMFTLNFRLGVKFVSVWVP